MAQHKAHDVAIRPRTEDIHISEDINFKSMLLPKDILQGLKLSGYMKPSPIQRKALPLVRSGLDLIIQAKAGTGKTCVFTIAALEFVQPSLRHLQVIVLAPTREIAFQITDVISAIGQVITGLKICSFIGGYPISQDKKNAVGCHIAVGSPGRMLHLLDEGILNARHVKLFVLDEADKLMEKVFVGNISKIFSYLPESKQVLACSATFTPDMIEFLKCYMHCGQYVSPLQYNNKVLLLGIRQYVSVLTYHVDRLAQMRLKEKHLLYLLQSVSFNQSLVFTNFHTRALSICSMLRGHGWSVDWIAGHQNQVDRVIALAHLKEQRVRVLVTTDLTARGIDVENVNLVINLDLPLDNHIYLHRMGRAGRFGSHGMVITVVSTIEELCSFQKLLGAIGGTSLSVNRVPEDLKNVDLWSTADNDLEQVYGIVESTETSQDMLEKSEISPAVGEKLSQDCSDILENTVVKNTEENFLGKDICLCNMYEAEPTNIDMISGPSLFAISKKEEHWKDVLPVVINESKIPLNTPVTLLGSKLIRVKFWDRILDEAKYDDKDLSRYEIKSTFETEIKFKNNLESNLCGSGVMLSLKEIVEALEKCVPGANLETSEVDKCCSKYKEIEQVLVKYHNCRAKLENYLAAFDSFDIVGWMAVDVKHNIVESLKTDKCNIFQFDLVKCTAGKSHIKVLSSLSDVKESHDYNDHVSTFNLAGFNLTSPFSLMNIRDKVAPSNTNHLLKAVDNTLKDKTDINKKRPIQRKEKACLKNFSESIGKHMNGLKEMKKINPLKQYNQKTAAKGNTYKPPKKYSKEDTPIVSSFNKTFFNGNDVKRSKNSINGYAFPNVTSPNRGKEMMLPGTKQHEKTTFNTKINANCVTGSVCEYEEKLKRPTLNSVKNQTSDKKEVVMLESSDENDTSCSELTEEPFNPCSVQNGHHRTPSDSEESGPYVDMSQNLTNGYKRHEFEESDSESSSESDVLCSGRVQDTYFDTTNCSYETSLAIKYEDFLRKLAKQGKNKRNSHYKPSHKPSLNDSYQSYDSIESEDTNSHSFQTACSHHCCSGNLDRDYAYVPSRYSHIYYDNMKFLGEVPHSLHSEHSHTKFFRDPQEFLKSEHFDDRTHFCRTKLTKASSGQNRSAKNTFTSYADYDELNQSADTSFRQCADTPRVLRSNDLFNEWYSTWYTEVRQRAHKLEMAEYIEMMSTP